MGSYFNASHGVKSTFRNPKLDQQYKAAKEAKVAIGLYVDIKAKTEEEALKELYEIRLAALKYPPDMGLWLHPTFTSKNKETNDKLVETYYSALHKLGFFDQVGFYCKKEELEKFNWESECEKWYWWMDRHLKSVDKIHYLPTPKFFMYDDPGDEDALIEPDYEGWEQVQQGMVSSSDDSTSIAGTLQKTINVPGGYGTYATFEKGDINWSKGTNQRKLFVNNASKLNVDENGFYRMSGRYVIAMGEKFGGAGTIVNITFRNGATLLAVVGDEKNPNDPGANAWGHDGGKCMVEYIVKSDHEAGNSGSTWYGNIGKAQQWLSKYYKSKGYNSGVKKVELMGSVL